MNPIMRLLLGSVMGTGFGDQFSKNQPSDLKSLTDALAAYKSAAGPDGNAPAQSPMDRIKAAFDSLKDMHKGPNQSEASMMPGMNGPSPFDTAQWPYGPMGAPSHAMASASAPPAPAGIPMPQPRPAEAPQPEANPMMSFFQRNAAMQRDPGSGDFIDPAAAASAGPGIFHGLFS